MNSAFLNEYQKCGTVFDLQKTGDGTPIMMPNTNPEERSA